MKKYILSLMLILVVSTTGIAVYGDIPAYEQKPHLEIKCPCGARFVTYEWLEGAILRRADKFIETHPCSHNTRLATPLLEKKQERLLVRELIGTETVGFVLSDWTSSYRCFVCGESLTTVWNRNLTWYCSKCKKYFNIEKGE